MWNNNNQYKSFSTINRNNLINNSIKQINSNNLNWKKQQTKYTNKSPIIFLSIYNI